MIANKTDFIGSLLLLVLGIAILAIALTYNVGTATRMGPGYFPMVLGGLMIALALFVGVASLRRSAAAPAEIAWRPFAAVTASLAGFVVAMAYGGLFPAVVATVLISSLGDARSQPIPALLLAAGVAIAAWLLFARGLGMPIPLFKVAF